MTLHMAMAALWGFAEATLFFIVPDVWLSAVAVRHGLAPALRACGFALAGAILGGALMYAWGAADAATARAVLDTLPAIGPAMIGGVRASLAEYGAAALFVGPLTGVPYKIYAVEAAQAGVGPWSFILVSIPARLLRFVLIAAVAALLSGRLSRFLDRRARTALLLAVWSGFYAVYLVRVPG